MPAEEPVCARTGMLPRVLHRPTAAAVAIATTRDAGFIGRILLGVLATIIWDKYQSRRHGAKPLANLWLEPLTVNVSADQPTASAKRSKPLESPRMRQYRGAADAGPPTVKVCDAW